MEYSKFRLRCFAPKVGKYHIGCGSAHELPMRYYIENIRDIDIMFYYWDICAIPWNRNPPKNFQGTLLRINSKETPPGYARLQINKGNAKDNPTYYRRPSILRETIGPSLKSDENYKYTMNLPKTFMHCRKSQDYVYAVYCPYWPPEVEEWKLRRRFNGWPDEKLIARITRGGCHFVSKPRTWTDTYDDSEWRFSFSKAELILIHSWTKFQKHVYHVLRSIKRTISTEYGVNENASLQTFFFKTLMFWACEEFPEHFWNEKNIYICILKVLIKLLDCLVERHLSHYFIPQVNIMSHLRDDMILKHELDILSKFMGNGIFSYSQLTESHTICSTIAASLEYRCLGQQNYIFPLNDDLNGRFDQYLSQCEWFLPRMKYLHRAIEANLCLMAIDNVILRRESENFSLCLHNFSCALLRDEDFHLRTLRNIELSNDEDLNATLRRKHLGKGVAVYRRCVEKLDECYEYGNFLPSPLHCATSVYRANFYFSALKSYNECQIECCKSLELLNKDNPAIFNNGTPYFVESYTPIFDEHLQVFLGFVTLHKFLSFRDCSNASRVVEVCLKLDALEFLEYLIIQCRHKIDGKFYPNTFLRPRCQELGRSCLSQMMEIENFSACVFNASLRQSGASEKYLAQSSDYWKNQYSVNQ